MISSTTGLAKGVLRDPIAPEKVGEIAEMMRQVLGFRPGGTAVIPAPLYHTAPNVTATASSTSAAGSTTW